MALVITERDILVAGLLGPKELSEASLGRLYQHFLKSGQTSWAILTSYRPEYSADPSKEPERTKDQNRESFTQLRKQLRDWGYGFSPLTGHWSGKDRDGNEYSGYEPSLFVYGISREKATEILKQYNQESVIYAGPDTKGNVQIIFQDGTIRNQGTFHPSKIGQFWSEIRGRQFTFEDELLANGFGNAMLLDSIKKDFVPEKVAQEELMALDLKLKSIEY